MRGGFSWVGSRSRTPWSTLLWSCIGCACIVYIVLMAHYFESHAHSHMMLTTKSDKHVAREGMHYLSSSWLLQRNSPNISDHGRSPVPSREEPLKPLDLTTLGSYLLPGSGLVSEALLTRLVLSTYNVSLAYAHNHSNVLTKLGAKTLLDKHANGEPIITAIVPTHLPLLAHRNTLFLITPTYPGRAPRRSFLRRHIASLRVAIDESPIFWKPQPLHMSASQVLWILVDDTPEPDTGLASMLRCAGVPFLYFPYGPTGTWGNAQRNAALMVVRALGRLGMMGPGYFMDDDSYVSPWLFEPMFQVQRALLWPIADIGQDGWEGPIQDQETGEILSWHAGWLERKFPVDMNAFCFHTSYLQDEAFFVMPLLFDFRGRGGETEFLQKLLDHKEDFEILCQECRFVWYNRPLGERDVLWPVECAEQVPAHIKQVPSDLLRTRSALYGDKDVVRAGSVPQQFDFEVVEKTGGGEGVVGGGNGAAGGGGVMDGDGKQHGGHVDSSRELMENHEDGGGVNNGVVDNGGVGGGVNNGGVHGNVHGQSSEHGGVHGQSTEHVEKTSVKHADKSDVPTVTQEDKGGDAAGVVHAAGVVAAAGAVAAAQEATGTSGTS